MKGEVKKLLDEEILPRIKASPFQVEVAGHSDSDAMPKKWQKFYKSNWELSAARGATCVRYMIELSQISVLIVRQCVESSTSSDALACKQT